MQLATTNIQLRPHERERLESITAELRRRRHEERLRYFHPQEPPRANDQKGFFESTADWRWIYGGNRSGKTEAGVVDCIWFCQGIHPVRSGHKQPPVHVRYVAPTFEGLGLILKKFQQLVPREWLKGGNWDDAYSGLNRVLTFGNGSDIKFKSTKQALNTFGGDDCDAVYQDEHIAELYFTENMARLTDRKGYFVATLTPEEGTTYEEDLSSDPPKGITSSYWFFDTRKNTYLDPEGVALFVATIRDPILAETKLAGHFMAVGGMVLPMYDPSIHIVPDRELHPDSMLGFCIDCHISRPCAAMWMAWEPNGDRIIYRTRKRFLDVEGWKGYIRAQSGHEKIQIWLGDQSDTQEERPNINDVQSIIYQFNQGPDKLPIVQVQKPPGSFKAGIFKLRNVMSPDPISRKPQLYIFESCNYGVTWTDGFIDHSVCWEMKHYQHKKVVSDEVDFRDTVRRINDHYADDARYLNAMGVPTPDPPVSKPRTHKPRGRFTGLH